jgi:hypothetical protein
LLHLLEVGITLLVTLLVNLELLELLELLAVVALLVRQEPLGVAVNLEPLVDLVAVARRVNLEVLLDALLVNLDNLAAVVNLAHLAHLEAEVLTVNLDNLAPLASLVLLAPLAHLEDLAEAVVTGVSLADLVHLWVRQFLAVAAVVVVQLKALVPPLIDIMRLSMDPMRVAQETLR